MSRSPRRSVRYIARGLAVALLVSGAGLTGAAPASAAVSSCFTVAMYKIGGTAQAQYVTYMPSGMPGTSGQFNCYLQYGHKGAAVQQLQESINDCYGARWKSWLTEDGSFGPATLAAVKRVQREEGITVDGSYGPQTRQHMKWKVARFSWCWEQY